MSSSTRVFCDDPAVMMQLMARIYNDTQPSGRADIGYAHGHTIDNEEQPRKELARLFVGGKINYIALSGYEGHMIPFRVSSYHELKDKLSAELSDVLKYNITDRVLNNKVVPVPMAIDRIPASTDSEALGLVRMAKEREWKTIVIATAGFHKLRGAVSAISWARNEGAGDINFYIAPVKADPWIENVTTSGGGAVSMRRIDSLEKIELQKINYYCAKGDLLTAKEILEYFDERDGRRAIPA